MSAKRRFLKKVHRDIRRGKQQLIEQIAREILQVPFWERFKLAFRIIAKRVA